MTTTLPNVVRTIRLDEARLRDLFDELDGPCVNDGPDSREHKRFLYRHKIILMQILQPGAGDATNFVCPTRNVSRGGLACLHGGYLHVGSRCVAHLRTIRGSFEPVLGTVVRCRHIQGNIHDVGIKFDFWIDPAQFCHEAVRYQVLIAEPDKSVATSVRTVLSALSCNVAVAENADQLVNLATSHLFGFVVIEADLPKSGEVSTIRSLRDSGYTGAVFAASVRNTEEEKKHSLEEGFDHFLAKPYNPKTLTEVAKAHFGAPIYSKLESTKETETLLAGFFKALPGKVRAIEQAMADGDEQLASLVQSFCELTGSLGFDEIAGAAGALHKSLGDGIDAAALRKSVTELTRLCRRLRP